MIPSFQRCLVAQRIGFAPRLHQIHHEEEEEEAKVDRERERKETVKGKRNAQTIEEAEEGKDEESEEEEKEIDKENVCEDQCPLSSAPLLSLRSASLLSATPPPPPNPNWKVCCA